jgi:hypothetical protein
MTSLSMRGQREDSFYFQHGDYRLIRTFFSFALREGISGEKNSDRLCAEVSGGEGDPVRSNED